MEYPLRYNLDDLYFQVERDGKVVYICLSDMTMQEIENKAKYWSKDNLLAAIKGLCINLRDLGDRYGFIANDKERLEEKGIYEDSRYRQDGC